MADDPTMASIIGFSVILLSLAAALSALINCIKRLTPKKIPIITNTTARYILTSPTQAFEARRYTLEPQPDSCILSAMCAICGHNPITTIYEPCSHSHSCPSCAHTIWNKGRKCPVCKCGITAIMHIVARNATTARVETLLEMGS